MRLGKNWLLALTMTAGAALAAGLSFRQPARSRSKPPATGVEGTSAPEDASPPSSLDADLRT